MEIIERLSAGDPEKKKYYIRLFLDTMEPELVNLRGADITAHQEPIRAILHKLKSQVQTIGAKDAHALMAEQEQCIKEGGRIEQEELERTCQALSDLIENLQELLK
jgi:HPt (histidine-containing phosphotransfer) domain-containing protein